ncbi:hypothetical protein V9K67_20605 [Paraflavisolibacter sp. H34]|uniref:hypothetical protein n=1 Tax=Huijunlia imazamoxiresistens TaxID=3127457 RepID=UPI00301695CB
MNKVLIIIFLLSVKGAWGQDYIAAIVRMLETKHYSEAFNFGQKAIFTLNASRKRNFQLEYYTWLALSLNQNPKTKQAGCGILNDYLKNNKYSFDNFEFLSKKKDSICNLKKEISVVDIFGSKEQPIVDNTKYKKGALLDAHFKSYKILRESLSFTTKSFFLNLTEEDFNRVTSQKIHKDNNSYLRDSSVIPNFEVGVNIDTLRAFIKSRYKADNYYKSKNFALVSKTKKSSELKLSSELLEKTLSFYNLSLSLPENKKMIFVYLADTYQGVSNAVYEIYKAYENDLIGYTDTRTNSIVAWIPSSTKIGTLKHELIHILCFNKFVLGPDWVEEGLASLYEESRFINSNLIGVNNWRLKFINALDVKLRDSLFQSMLGHSETSYDYVESQLYSEFRQILGSAKKHHLYSLLENDIDVRAFFVTNFLTFCKNSMNRYLFLYLQDKGKLLSVLRQLDLGNITSDNLDYKSFLQILLEATNSSNLEEFFQKFNSWLSAQKIT